MISKSSNPVIGKLRGSPFSGGRTVTIDGATSPRSPLDFKNQSAHEKKQSTLTVIGKTGNPVTGKLAGSPFSGIQTEKMDGATSPRSPLDFKNQSPKGPKSYDFAGVGLAFVATLDHENNFHNQAVYNRSSNKSISIPLKYSPNNDEDYYDEDYTIVTCHGPDKKPYTKVYGTKCNKVSSVFDISPAKFGDYSRLQHDDFLSSCYLCHKKLHGKDIYMYRGEKAFCSTECRYSQIVMDEHKEKCYSEISRTADIASSPNTNGQKFSTGILAI